MDAIAGLLDGPRAREAFLLRASMDPPWSLRIVDEAPLTIVAMVRGDRQRSLVDDPQRPRRVHARAQEERLAGARSVEEACDRVHRGIVDDRV